ncbi:MAG: NlpC/P60 family protein, partial [Actinomycetota bacterium]|nr:NlpC/P60 family protein [Actinomycetota bacterium]
DAAIAEARRQIGKPYEWGAAGPDSFDCSGLTLWSWRAGGKSLPHSSRAQWTATSRVSIDAIKPGDLLFYGDPIHHVGLYIGNGQMIEASQTGTPVRYASIYRSDYTGAGRVN